MQRLILIGVLGAGLWVLWSVLGGSAPDDGQAPGMATAAGVPVEAGEAALPAGPTGPAEADAPQRDLRMTQSPGSAGDRSEGAPGGAGQSPAVADRQAAAVVEAARAGNWTAAAAGFSLLRKQSSPALESTLVEAVRAVEVASLPALFGRRNDFLHTPAGRRAAEIALERCEEVDADVAVRAMTGLLEVAMRGRIDKGDAAARGCVDKLWAAMQRPLRRTVLNPAHVTGARTHKVQPGEVLDRISRDFRRQGVRVESGTIAAFNRITDPRRLRAGQVVKVPVDPIRGVVEKRSYSMALYVGDVIFRFYWVGHGADDCTPEETFTIGAKQERPDWYADGRVVPYGHPDNVLGDYFVKFEHPSFTGFGAHGTSEPESIGTMASAGCLRLADAAIEDFFRVVPRGAEIEIRATR